LPSPDATSSATPPASLVALLALVTLPVTSRATWLATGFLAANRPLVLKMTISGQIFARTPEFYNKKKKEKCPPHIRFRHSAREGFEAV
jgi:hypothetical protein